MDPAMQALLPTIQADTHNRIIDLMQDPAGLRERANKAARATWGTGVTVAAQYDTETAGLDGEPVPLRVFIPLGVVTGTYLFIHGGGWVLGSHANQDPQLRRIASEAGVAIVSVGYRMAPEHPYPVPVDDCVAAARWLIAGADGRLPTANLAIGGSSAGANLAAATLLRLRDDGEADTASPFAAAVFMYGVFKAVFDLPSAKALWDKEIVLSGPMMQFFADCYIPGGMDPLDPYLSPFCADLAGMPPAIFQVGTLDHLHSDSVVMAQKWKAAGAAAEYFEYKDMPHGFVNYAQLPAAGIAIGRTVEFLKRHLADRD